MCVAQCMWRSEDNFQDPALSSRFSMGAGDHTRLSRLGHKYLHPPSRLPGLPALRTDSPSCLYLSQALARTVSAEWALVLGRTV